MAPYWMRLSPEQAVGWYCVPKDTAHQPQHAFYGLNLTEEDMRNGWWMTNREFFAVLASADFPEGLRLHIATIDGDSFGDDEDFNVLDPGYKMHIGLNQPHAVLKLAEILLQHTAPTPLSVSPKIFKQVSHDELKAKASQSKFKGFRISEDNYYYRLLTGESDQDEQFVRLFLGYHRLSLSFYRFKFDRQLFYETSYLDVSEPGLWELATLIKGYAEA